MKRVLCLFIFIAMLIFGIALWADPIEVWNQNDLIAISMNPSGNYIQMANITIVGNWSSITLFTGSYNGNGFIIQGLSPQPFFRATNGATVENVTFVGIDIDSGGTAVGGLIGHALNSTIRYCSTIDGLIDIYSFSSDVGGIVGILENSYMEYCYNTVRVRGFDRVGGLVGASRAGSLIYRSYNVGPVIDSDRVGGLVGINMYGSKIEECWAANLVQGLNQVGGLVGINYGYILNSFKVCTTPVYGDYVGGLVGLNLRINGFNYQGANAVNGVVQNCYTNGIVVGVGEAEHIGGLIGWGGPGGPPSPGYPGSNAYYGPVYNSYWDMETSGIAYNHPGGVGFGGEGRTTAQMTYPYDLQTTYINWNGWNAASNIWSDDSGSYNRNRGYPTLAWQTYWYPCGDIPQPVELSSFTASVIANGAVNVQWRAETETNVLGYKVYRSTINNLNEAVNINYPVIIARNVSTPTSYSYLDEDVQSGVTYYYWLESIDLDMSNTFHGPISVTLEENIDIPDPVYTTLLRPNYPNPFIPSTTISYSLRENTEMVELKIYNIMGQLVRTLHSGSHNKGDFEVVWNGKDNNDRNVPSGIYFYRLTTPTYDKINKMLLLK